ncbi:reverse transcriptase domain-containing protein [Tanacetum coccineum]
MIAIFQDMLETSMEVFMDDFSVFGDSFDSCLNNLEQMLIRCKQAHLVLNWEKCHFMVTEGIVLGHKVSYKELEVDKAKIDVIAKFPPPTNVKAIRSFLGHAGFYRRFIKDFLKIQFEYILVAIDYVSKWAEGEALPTNDARVVVNFLKKIFSRFGILKALISDRGTHFCNRQMEKILKKYGVHHRIATAYHPQTSGQVENTNKALKRILEKTVKENPSVCSRKLDDALWAFRTAYKTPIGTTPYRLLLLKTCHKPFENRIAMLTGPNEAAILILRLRKEFKAGDKVLLYNSKYKFKAPKLRPKWCGPFIVKHGYPSGYVELYDKHRGSFIVNEHLVKLYHDEEQLNKLSIEEIHHMCEDGRMKAIPFMAPFPANYRETMPWASEKPYIYSVVENTCNEAKLYDLGETWKGIVIKNILYVPSDGSSLEKK